VRWRPAHGAWKSAETWPPPGAATETLYLGSGGTLSLQAPEAAEDATWTHDPDHLVPSKVDNPFAFLLQYPDERKYGERDDVLVFSAAPVDEVLELAGPIALTAVVRSTGPEMDVFARLLDVAADGSARYIARGQMRVDPAAEDRLVRIPLWHAGYLLRAGHGLCLHLFGSDFPEFVPHPGTGANRWLATETRANHQTIRLGGNEPARLTLTVLP
jgi:putative CocE/NonD family hydrolase